MSYFLIGESHAGDDPLYVLWTFEASRVRVLPVGSRDRRGMQVVGRRLFEASTPGADPQETLRQVLADRPQHAERPPLRLVELDDDERQVIERSITDALEATEDRAPAA